MTAKEKILSAVVILLCVGFVVVAHAAFLYDRPTIRCQAVEIVDGNGRMRATLGVSKDGTTAIGFYDAEGNMRCSVGLTPQGEPAIIMQDQDKQLLWGAP